jgi:putative two-component system response regulator
VTGLHTQRVGLIAASIGRQLGFEEAEIDLIRLAAPLHDIGKIGIPDGILLKPGKLEADEFELMKQHVVIGAGILSKGESPIILLAREIALFHHERWDGRGYCQGLAGDKIPLAARIVSVADAFDAMTHDRPYHGAISEEIACKRILECSGTQFDPAVVDAFLVDREVAGETLSLN